MFSVVLKITQSSGGEILKENIYFKGMETRGDDDKERVIGLIDMDCFECQVYQRDKPKLKGSPCVVANSKGRIVSVNYEARPSGISRSLCVSDAKKKCENLTVFKIPDVLGKPDNSKLRHASQEVLDIIKDYIGKNGLDQIVLEYSPTDEFYLDLTNQVDHELQNVFKKAYYGMIASSQIFPHLIAILLFLCTLLQHNSLAALFVCLLIMPKFLKELKSTRERMRLHCGASLIRRVCNEIESKSRMTASGGVSGNKFRAKLASSENKPNGVAIIEGNDFNDILSSKKIRDVPGLKSGLGEKVSSTWGIREIQELKKYSRDELQRYLEADEVDKILNILTGIDPSPVIAKEFSAAIHCRKTIFAARQTGHGETYGAGKGKPNLQKLFTDRCTELLERLEEEKKRNGRRAKNISVEISYLTNPSDESSAKGNVRTFTPKWVQGAARMAKEGVRLEIWTYFEKKDT